METAVSSERARLIGDLATERPEGEIDQLVARQRSRNAWLLLLPALTVILVAAVAPLVTIAWVSFWRVDGLYLVRTIDTEAWRSVLSDPTFYRLAWSTVQTVIIVLVLVGVLGLTAGYFLARFVTNRKLQALLLMLAILPFWTSYLIRIITWQPLFGNSGVINFLLGKAGLPQMELFLFNQRAMIFAMTSLYVVFVVGPVFWALSRIDPEVIAASRSLGASAWTTFRTVELPLARGGLVVGLFFASIFLFGDYATGRLIGGGTNPMLSDAISQYAGSGQWPVAATLAVVLFGIAILVLAIFMRIYDLRKEL
ncbi:MAG TPA: ABC transporter permease [Thermomicrobiales bacterium]|jgi:putative spermidine/putrescine transport system permease protein|nr:ABC transporter permease [Thermomicrobiales bacterium]